MSDIEIGRAKRARRAYAFDDIAVVPSRRTRDPQDVSVSWTIDAFTFEIPVLAAPMDSVVSPATAIAIGKLGGLGVLDLEGVWTRYEDAEKVLKEIRALKAEGATKRLQQIYREPIKPELVTSAARRDPRRRRAGRRRAQPAAHPGSVPDRGGCRGRPVRDPRHHGERRAREQDPSSRST